MPERKEEVEEPEDAGTDHEVPVDLTIIHEVLEWEEAIEKQKQESKEEDAGN